MTPGRKPVTSEIQFAVGGADADLHDRLDKEIYDFNAAATGHHDGRELSIAVRGGDGAPAGRADRVDLGRMRLRRAAVGARTTSAAAAWEPGCWPPPRTRSGAAAATGSP